MTKQNSVAEIPEVDEHTEITVNAERKDGGLVYSSVRYESFEDKKRTYNALTTDKQIGDYLNEVLDVEDIIAGDGILRRFWRLLGVGAR